MSDDPRTFRYRIIDLLGKRDHTVLCESGDLRDLVDYHDRHYRPGRTDWGIQFNREDPPSEFGWRWMSAYEIKQVLAWFRRNVPRETA